MKKYNRVMLGKGSAHASECFEGGYVGANFGIHEDLSKYLPDEWREFNRHYIPVFLASQPERSKVAAGLACGALWTISKGLRRGDIVLSPDGTGNYEVGEINGDYSFVPDAILPHRRPVKWLGISIPRSEMSEPLRNSTGSIGTVCDLAIHSEEVERLIQNQNRRAMPIAGNIAVDEGGDLLTFAMEKHLEDFLIANWQQTELGKEFAVFEEDGELVGQQYQTGAGVIDILAISKDRTRLLVVELKRGRTSDRVVGQVLRYMGYIKEQIADPQQSVEGAIIALEDDQTMRWALSNVPAVTFYKYQISFKLEKG